MLLPQFKILNIPSLSVREDYEKKGWIFYLYSIKKHILTKSSTNQTNLGFIASFGPFSSSIGKLRPIPVHGFYGPPVLECTRSNSYVFCINKQSMICLHCHTWCNNRINTTVYKDSVADKYNFDKLTF